MQDKLIDINVTEYKKMLLGFRLHMTVFTVKLIRNSHLLNFGVISKNITVIWKGYYNILPFPNTYLVWGWICFLYLIQHSIFQQNKCKNRYSEFRYSNYVLSQILKKFLQKGKMPLLTFLKEHIILLWKYVNRVWFYYYYLKMNQQVVIKNFS